jgi:hypothetical protein
MKKFGEFICKHKIAILIIALILIIPSILGMMATRVNYDILTYLPDGIETIQGENILSEDFGMGSFSVVIVENMSQDDIIKLEDKIREIDSVGTVIGITDVTGSEIPIEMLPDEVLEKLYKDDNTTAILVTLQDGIAEDRTLDAIQELRDITDQSCKISGMSATNLDIKNICNSEVIIYVIIAVILCILILSIALDSYIAPLILLANIGIAVLYNMGTNIIFGEISYITKAISAVLQLGVTMDFAIFLYHSYKQEKQNEQNNDKAMANAIASTLKSVVGSSITTIAGFLALCAMSLTLGKDIGLVMAKGVLFGVICTVTILPALILVFDKLIEKTSHKVILPKFTKVKNFAIKHYKIIIAVFIVILPFAIYGYTHTESYYNLTSGLPESLESVSANNELSEKFGMTSTELILIDKNIPDSEISEMLEKIDNLDGVALSLSYSKIIDNLDMPAEMLPEEVTNMLTSDKYQMIIVCSEYENATDELNNQIAQVDEIIKSYDENSLMAGEGPLMKDLVEIANHDFNSVNTFSIIVIFILMFVVLQSVSLPVILIIVIEFAIFINLGIPAFTGTKIPFVASITIGTIQLGATIDYAILITNKYILKRKEGLSKRDSIDFALETSISSIVVSGLCFFGATFGVGMYSEIEMISALCVLISRGAIISMITVILALPAFLMIFDKIICKTTLGMKKIEGKRD